jgi:hypothetical protein
MLLWREISEENCVVGRSEWTAKVYNASFFWFYYYYTLVCPLLRRT